MPERALPAQRECYFEAYEAGALAALAHVSDERSDLEDVTMRAAEKIGAEITSKRESGLT